MRGIATACLVAALTITAAAQDPEELLRQGLFEEEGNQNLEKARESYLQLAELYDRQRRYAATALFRLGEIARKEGHAEEAAMWYRRVLSEFSENESLVRLSRQNLAGLGVESGEAAEDVAASEEVDEETAELARLKELKETSPDLIDGTDEKGWRPIHYAAARGWMKVLEYLLEAGAAVDGRTAQSGWTALHLAVGHGHLAMVKRLSDAGADLESEVDLSAIDQPFDGMPLPPFENLHGYWRPLHLAVLWGRGEVARFLIEAGCEPEPMAKAYDQARIERGYVMPVTLAIVTKRPDILELLLEAGAGINRSVEGRPWPAVVAATRYAPEMIPLLLERGADPNHLDRVSWDYLPALIKAGAEVNRVYEGGRTPLHLASTSEQAKVLLEQGAGLEARDQQGFTPLLNAVRYNRRELVEFYLESGADPEARSNEGESIFALAGPSALPVVYEHLVYPEATQPDGVVLFDHGQAFDQNHPFGIERAKIVVRRHGTLSPPSLIDVLLHAKVHRVAWIRVIRRGQEGAMVEVAAVTGDGLIRGVPEFPALEWGDIVEVIQRTTANTLQQEGADPRGWWNGLPAREVTFVAGPWKRTVRIDPKLIPWQRGATPWFGTTPWEHLDLAWFANAGEFALDPFQTKLVRGGTRAAIPDAGGLASGQILKDGDMVELTLNNEILQGGPERWMSPRVLFTLTTIRGVEIVRTPLALFPSLLGVRNDEFDALTDFSNVVIQRPKAGGGMEEISVDVAAVARELLPNGEPDESFSALDRDVELKDGDLVILSPPGEVVTIGTKPDEEQKLVLRFLQAAAEERERMGAEEK